jgi:asparagine synthetase B (glutamine-hydrolysing)
MIPLLAAVGFDDDKETFRKIATTLGKSAFLVTKGLGSFVSNYPIVEHGSLLISGNLNWLSVPEQEKTITRSNFSTTYCSPFLERWQQDHTRTLDGIDGEFALVICSTTSRTVWAIRDIFGVMPLHYFADQNTIAFSSHARQLWKPAARKAPLNNNRILDFIVSDLEHADHVSTFRRHIFKVPIGGVITWNHGKKSTRQYWNPDIEPAEKQQPYKTVVGRFNELLDASLSKQINPQLPVGLLLSGGLDSNTILSRWHSAPEKCKMGMRHLFSMVPESENRGDPETSMLLDQASLNPNLPHHCITPSQAIMGMSPVEHLVQKLEDPFGIWTFASPSPCYFMASQLGLDQMIDGVDGNLVAGIPGNYWKYIWKSGAYWDGLVECVGCHLHDGLNHWNTLMTLGKFLTGHYFPRFKGYLNTMRGPRRAEARQAAEWMNDLAIRRSVFSVDQLEKRIQQRAVAHTPKPPGSFQEELINHLKSPMIGVAIDRYRMAGMPWGVTPRHPLLDRSLIEFLIRQSWEHRIKKGEPKQILRHSLRAKGWNRVSEQGSLPHLGPLFTHALQRDYIKRHGKPKTECLDAINGYVDASKYVKDWQACAKEQSLIGVDDKLWDMIMLGEWLVKNN